MQEAFCHLKGWYRVTLEMQAKPCYHPQWNARLWSRLNLYMRRVPPGNPLIINFGQIEIKDDAPSDKDIRLANIKLSNGRAAGASRMRTKHVKDWLRGVQREEDAEGQRAPGDGNNWQLLAHLLQATCTFVIVPHQLL
jgi:hypothetical protein